MTIQALLDQVAEKRRKHGEQTLTLSALEQLLRLSLSPPVEQPEPGYPKKLTRAVPNSKPWVAQGPPPPESTWVKNREEEDAARAGGFR
jgi:hypothetical protein